MLQLPFSTGGRGLRLALRSLPGSQRVCALLPHSGPLLISPPSLAFPPLSVFCPLYRSFLKSSPKATLCTQTLASGPASEEPAYDICPHQPCPKSIGVWPLRAHWPWAPRPSSITVRVPKLFAQIPTLLSHAQGRVPHSSGEPSFLVCHTCAASSVPPSPSLLGNGSTSAAFPLTGALLAAQPALHPHGRGCVSSCCSDFSSLRTERPRALFLKDRLVLGSC